MKIPNSVIYAVGDVLGSWYYSHTKLNTLFGGNGFPGDPPAGNCIQKCQEWMRRANDTADVDQLELLGLVLVEFMNLNFKDDPRWNDNFRRVMEVLAKNSLAFELNGRIITISSENSAEPTSQNASIAQSVPPHLEATGRAPSSTVTQYPVIIVVTVNDNETHALLDAFLGEGKAPVHNTIGGVTYTELGIHGGHLIVNTVCEMGAGGIGASQQRTRQAIVHWHPLAIISVGIAFGLDETKQKIGEVLVSSQIQDYELGRLNADGTLTPRGDKPSCADVLRNRLRQTNTTEKRRHSDWPKVRFGLVLSGQKLVDNLDYRETLKTLFTEAVGGEMEGIGLYVSASEAKVDWIVVKGICDWGYNKNQADKDAWQRLAGKNAARVLKAALDVGSLYSSKHANTGDSHAKPTIVPEIGGNPAVTEAKDITSDKNTNASISITKENEQTDSGVVDYITNSTEDVQRELTILSDKLEDLQKEKESAELLGISGSLKAVDAEIIKIRSKIEICRKRHSIIEAGYELWDRFLFELACDNAGFYNIWETIGEMKDSVFHSNPESGIRIPQIAHKHFKEAIDSLFFTTYHVCRLYEDWNFNGLGDSCDYYLFATPCLDSNSLYLIATWNTNDL